MTIILFLSGQLLKYHIHRRLLRPCTMGGIHLAEIPLHAEQNISAHDEPIAILFIVGSDRMCKITSLIQDVINLNTQIEGTDILGNLHSPPPFWLTITFSIAVVESICQV